MVTTWKYLCSNDNNAMVGREEPEIHVTVRIQNNA